MSHSQFHCTARVYLDMHGLIFETSICYWQDQPGSRAAGRRPAGPARRRPLSLGSLRLRLSRLASVRLGRTARPSVSPSLLPFLAGSTAAAAGANDRRSLSRSAGRAALGGEARPLPGAAPPTSPARGRSGGRCAAAFGGALRAPPAGAGRALGARPGLTRPPGPADERTGNNETPPRKADVLEENATSRRARPSARGPSPGAARSAAGGDAAGKPTRAAAARKRRGDRRTPPVPTPRRLRRSPPLLSLSRFLSLRLRARLTASQRFSSVATPPARCSRPATRRAPNRGRRRRLAQRTRYVCLRLAGPLGHHTAGFGRASPPFDTGRTDGRAGAAGLRALKAAAALGPGGRAPRLAYGGGKRTGEGAARA